MTPYLDGTSTVMNMLFSIDLEKSDPDGFNYIYPLEAHKQLYRSGLADSMYCQAILFAGAAVGDATKNAANPTPGKDVPQEAPGKGYKGVGSTGKNIVGTDFNEVKPTQDWIDMDQVNNYAARLRAGETLAAIEAINIPGKGIYILDGHHRYVASQLTGISVEMRITTGQGPVGLPDWSLVEPLK